MSWLATQKWNLNGKEITISQTFATLPEARRWAAGFTPKSELLIQADKQGFSVSVGKNKESENVPA